MTALAVLGFWLLSCGETEKETHELRGDLGTPRMPPTEPPTEAARPGSERSIHVVTWAPEVLAIATAADEDESFVALVERIGRSEARIAIHRVAHDAHPPELSTPWAVVPLASLIQYPQVSVAPLRDGLALYYRAETFEDGTDWKLGHAVLWVDASGAPIAGEPDWSLPTLWAPSDSCALTAAGEEVVVACRTADLTLQLCPFAGPCAEPTWLDASPVPTSPNPPAVLVGDAVLDVFYPVSGPRLVRTRVERATGAVLTREDLYDGPPSELSRYQTPTVASPLRVDEGVLVAFGHPTVLGIWNDTGELLRSTATTPVDFGADAMIQRAIYSPWVVADGVPHTRACWDYSGMDRVGSRCHLLRAPLDTLEPELSLELPTVSELFVPPAPAAALYDDRGSLRYLPLESGGGLSDGSVAARPEWREQLPRALVCEADTCQLLLTDDTRYEIDRRRGIAANLTAVDPPLAAMTYFPTASATLVFGAASSDSPGLVLFDPFTDSRSTVPLPGRATAAFAEREGFRVFFSNGPEGGVSQGLVRDGVLSETSAVSVDERALVRRCGERYVALRTGFDGGHLDTFDLVDPDFVARTPIDLESVMFWGCVQDSLFVVQRRSGFSSDQIDVFDLSGRVTASVAATRSATPVAVRADEATGRLLTLWDLQDASEPAELIVLDAAGGASRIPLALPGSFAGHLVITNTDAAALSVVGDDVAFAWLSQNEEILVSTLTLP